ncbi:hypothetical protein GHT06_017013 [Daphnia sinensis]|uniref:Uncharacterized protein n=1 Tax=Daphnia sinensis TaxID=1820382 RepID=A0AAD5L7M0_9CRUS|nr:hypothetical protein GHT06_017013 [Daphnia sinensis]
MSYRMRPTHHFVNKFHSKHLILIAKEIGIIHPPANTPLSQLLNDFHDFFASKDSELGNTNLIKHAIDTQGRGPLRQRPYRITNNQWNC